MAAAKTNGLQRIEQGLAQYYADFGKKYGGEFKIYFDENGFDLLDLEDEMNIPNVDDCSMLDFDDNFPMNPNITTAGQSEEIFRILKKYYDADVHCSQKKVLLDHIYKDLTSIVNNGNINDIKGWIATNEYDSDAIAIDIADAINNNNNNNSNLYDIFLKKKPQKCNDCYKIVKKFMKPKLKRMKISQLFNGYKSRIKRFELSIHQQFPVPNNNMFKFPKKEVYQHMKSCYPIVHGSVLSLAYNFIMLKAAYGSSIEKALYKDMKLIQFFHRLATKRAVVFCGVNDQYLLRNGYGYTGKWELVGTENEQNADEFGGWGSSADVTIKPKLVDYLSYDELIISALCGISSGTHFINDGNRYNKGQLPDENADFYPFSGIYMGLVGARFERRNYMEHALMVIDNKQNTKNKGYGNWNDKAIDTAPEYKFDINNELNPSSILSSGAISSTYNSRRVAWRAFEQYYGKKYFPRYKEAKVRRKKLNNDDEFIKAPSFGGKAQFLDREMFKQRIRISLELFYFDADRRAKLRINKLKRRKIAVNACGTTYGAYCYVVGLGTGVWSFIKDEQDRLIVEVTREIIMECDLGEISAVYFGWMDENCMNKYVTKSTYNFSSSSGSLIDAADQSQTALKQFNRDTNGNFFINDKFGHKINIFSGNNNPGDILRAPYNNCLTVAMYAWDSNAFPGNEYYFQSLSGSGDPAAAACSTISFVQNSEINREYINGSNTGLYFYNQQTNQYEFYKLGDIDFENNKKKWLKKSILSTPCKRDSYLISARIRLNKIKQLIEDKKTSYKMTEKKTVMNASKNVLMTGNDKTVNNMDRKPGDPYSLLNSNKKNHANLMKELNNNLSPIRIDYDKKKDKARVRLIFIGGKQETLKLNLDHTVKDLYQHTKAVSGYNHQFKLLGGFPPKPLTDPNGTIQSEKLNGSRISQRPV